MTDNPLWDLLQDFMDDPAHRYPPKPADIARETGVSDQVLSKWKSRPTLPTPEQLSRVAEGTGISYIELLNAALHGRNYLPIGFNLSLLDERESSLQGTPIRTDQYPTLDGALVALQVPQDERPPLERLLEVLGRFRRGEVEVDTPVTMTRDEAETVTKAVQHKRTHDLALAADEQDIGPEDEQDQTHVT